MRAAAGAADFNNLGFAAGAGGSLFTKDFEELGVVADITVGVDKMLEGSATDCY